MEDGNSFCQVTYDSQNNVIEKKWFFVNTYKEHRDCGPSTIQYYSNGQVKRMVWKTCGCIGYLVRDANGDLVNGPHVIDYHANGVVKSLTWYSDGRIARFNGPAYMEFDHNGKLMKEEWRGDLTDAEMYRRDNRKPSYMESYQNGDLTIAKYNEDI